MNVDDDVVEEDTVNIVADTTVDDGNDVDSDVVLVAAVVGLQEGSLCTARALIATWGRVFIS